MSYKLKRNETIEYALRRITMQQIDLALHHAENRPEGDDKAVHRGRRACKSIRAMLRLVQPVFADAKAEKNSFRDAAKAMSASRDRLVLCETADALATSVAGSVGKQTRARQVVDALAVTRNEDAADDVHDRLEAFAKTMRQARARAERWSLEAEGFQAIQGGLARRYKQARKAMKHAAGGGGGDAFHEWRKRTKDFDHHLRLLTPIWKKPMKATRKQASKLGDILGDHHDLVVLVATLEADPDRYGGELTIVPIREAALAKQRELEPEAFAVGVRLYAESRSDLLDRLEAYWDAWRNQHDSKAGRLAAA